MTLNRNTAPGFHTINSLHFPDYQTIVINRGLKVYALQAGTQPVIRLDLVFEAGLCRQVKNAQAAFTSSMLSEGTKNHSALSLAESLDYYGSYFQTRSNADDSVATLYCLDKHFSSCLPFFLEALTQSVFPEKELEIQRKNAIQKLVVNERKNNYHCRKNYYKNIFGANHPYAAFSEKTDLENIARTDLISFYEARYQKGLNYVLLSGAFQQNSLDTLISHLESTPLYKTESTSLFNQIETNPGKHFIEKNDSVQSAIRIGKKSIGRKDPDFRKLQFLNLILGGYFGSRLMKNIREDKGLTYGIYSVIEPFQNGSTWYVDSEINTKNRGQGIAEIYKEMEMLKTTPIPNKELETAKNYYLGSFLRSLDGPFSLADRLKIMIDNQLPATYYAEFVSILNTTTSEELLLLANKYFGTENIVEMVVGKK